MIAVISVIKDLFVCKGCEMTAWSPRDRLRRQSESNAKKSQKHRIYFTGE